MTGQWAGGCGVELGKAVPGLPGELGCGSEWGIPAFLSCCSLACGSLALLSMPPPLLPLSLKVGQLRLQGTHWLLPRPRLLPVHLAVCLL